MKQFAVRAYSKSVPRWGCVVVILAIGTGCGSGPKACSAVGADSGVSLSLDAGIVPANATATISACVDGACDSQTYSPATSPMFVAVSPISDGEVTVKVSITVGVRTVFTGTTKAKPIKVQPNGPGCDPTVWQARVIAHANGQLSD